jgi:hypothetical protein
MLILSSQKDLSYYYALSLFELAIKLSFGHWVNRKVPLDTPAVPIIVLNIFLQLTDGLAVVAFRSILQAIVGTPAVTLAAKLGWDSEEPDADKENRK